MSTYPLHIRFATRKESLPYFIIRDGPSYRGLGWWYRIMFGSTYVEFKREYQPVVTDQDYFYRRSMCLTNERLLECLIFSSVKELIIDETPALFSRISKAYEEASYKIEVCQQQRVGGELRQFGLIKW